MPKRPERWQVGTVLLLLAALASPGLAAADAPKARTKAKEPAAAAAAQCKADKDCVTVLDDCCSCAQGGRQRALPRKEQKAYEKGLKKQCEGAMCTAMMSNDPTCRQVPVCEGGTCKLADAKGAAGGAPGSPPKPASPEGIAGRAAARTDAADPPFSRRRPARRPKT
jgi:hypothetical protein